MGIELPADCRVETTIENHDWLSAHTKGLSADDGPIIICNVGGGNVAVTRNIYRVVSFAHAHSDIGKFQKKLLHGEGEEERAWAMRLAGCQDLQGEVAIAWGQGSATLGRVQRLGRAIAAAPPLKEGYQVTARWAVESGQRLEDDRAGC